MSKLNIDQKIIRLLLTDKHSDFLIPDYQRPYAWGEDECAALWTIYLLLRFRTMIAMRLAKNQTNTFLGRLLPSKTVRASSR